MKISVQRNTAAVFILVIIGSFVAVSYLAVASLAQNKTALPARTGHVNDFAGVVDEKTRQRLEVMLENLKLRSGIELDVATVQTTGARDIFEFSRDLANEWNRGARNSSKKSLLLVLAVNEKTAATQFSRSVQADLPDGILGELSLRMRSQINSGHFSESLSDGVSHFINSLAKKSGFDLKNIDQVQVATTTPGAATPAVAAAVDAPTERNSSETLTTVSSPPVKAAKGGAGTAVPPKSSPAPSNYVNTPEDDADEAEEVELALTLPLSERLSKLKGFLETYPNSKARPRAFELIVSTYAGLGDQKLKAGDSQGGVEQLMLAIAEAPPAISEQLFSGVISQIPSNLYLRSERPAAYDAARKIEAKYGSDAKRLLVLAGFYLGIEDGEEAARVAAQAVKLAPDLADAHRALGLGLHVALRLDEAAAEYKRALELEPNSKKPTRRSLADLHRAAGKAEAALALYREQLAAEPTDKAARAGVVLSLLELNRAEEAKKELESALASDPTNLILLAGVSYWFAAHNESERALDLAQKAVQVEPRYTWSQIALARALTGQKRPLEAERAIRFAGQYGKFPTLDYELASVLASVGLYDEAANVLKQSFTLKQGRIETRLAGRVVARADTFTELLAPERRASIFQFAGAERAGDASTLKALLAFTTATEIGERGKLDGVKAAIVAKEFAAGTDEMRAYRQIYAANRLIKRGIALQTAFELTEAARGAVDAALTIPGVTVAVQAEELRDIRSSAIARGNTPEVPEASRNVLANILRGRVEDLAGLALFNQDKTELALEHLRRAVAILPEDTPAWRNALWHLGTALDQSGEKQEALNYYIRSYNAGVADSLRRGVIEGLYRRTHGSLKGLDDLIGSETATNFVPAPVVQTSAVTEAAAAAPVPEVERVAATEPTPLPSPAIPLEPSRQTATEAAPLATPNPDPSPTSTPTPESPTATPTPEELPLVEATPKPTSRLASTPDATLPAPQVEPTPDPSPHASATPTPEVQPSVSEPAPQPSPQSPAPQTGETRNRFAATIKVTGKVKNGKGEGMANVVVALISPRGTVLTTSTDMEGNYSFILSTLSQGYRMIPSRDGFVFEPVVKVLTALTQDQKGIDFVGTATP